MANYISKYTGAQIDKAVGDVLNGNVGGTGGGGNITIDDTLTKAGAAADAKATGDRLTALSEEIEELKGEGGTETVVLDIPLSSGYYYGFKDTSSDYNISEVIKSSSTSLYTPTPVDLGASAVGKKLRIISNDYKTDSGRFTGFCKTADGVTNKNYGFSEKNNFVYDEENQCYVMEIPIYTRYLYISLESRARPVRIEMVSESSVYAGRSAYVSVTGSDENGDGSNGTPFATVSKALSAGFEDIVVKGGVYRQRITIDENSRNHDGKRVSISPADPDGRVIFVDPDAVIATDETHVSGKVYSATTDKMFADGNVWIFQDGVQDASTLISDAERHPLERGMEYRCGIRQALFQQTASDHGSQSAVWQLWQFFAQRFCVKGEND